MRYDLKQLSFLPAQLPQSSYFALQLPLNLFGLGRAPNFVNKLDVETPRAKHAVNIQLTQISYLMFLREQYSF